MIQFNFRYFILTLLFFITEVLIALFVHDNFVRPYLGDVLVVILIYCFVKSFLKVPVITAAASVLLFAFAIEFLQYLNIVELLGWQQSRLASTVVGRSFSWADILCYLVGCILIVAIEKVQWRRNK
nr:DUF2809 domain-containing protein [uncultured Flavobacterium sp.]